MSKARRKGFTFIPSQPIKKEHITIAGKNAIKIWNEAIFNIIKEQKKDGK